MKPFFLFYVSILSGIAGAAYGQNFEVEDNGAVIVIRENAKPVLAYHYRLVSPPMDAGDLPPRGCYIHPLYGLQGDILTEDWPEDHRHHRGVFWGWPWCQVSGKRMDLWLCRDARQHFEKWLEFRVLEEKVVLVAQNAWRFDDDPKKTPVRERVKWVVYRATELGRCVDVELQLENLSAEPVVLQGQQDANKGYGGFCVRPDSKRSPLEFTSILGKQEEDTFELASPWVDVSSRASPDGDYSGIAIFQHPDNPDYPHKGWLIRHYGFLGASWPHTREYSIAPRDTLSLRYRLYIHRGNAEEGKVGEAFNVFVAETK